MPDDYTAPDVLEVGDPIRASWVALLIAALNLFDDRFSERAIALQASVDGMQVSTFVDVPYPLDFVPVVSGDATITYYSKTTNAATSVQMRYYNVTDSAVVADSSSTAHTGTSWVTESKAIALIAGKTYRLQIAGSNDGNPIIGYATLL